MRKISRQDIDLRIQQKTQARKQIADISPMLLTLNFIVKLSCIMDLFIGRLADSHRLKLIALSSSYSAINKVHF